MGVASGVVEPDPRSIYMSGSPVVVYPSNGEFRTTSALYSVGTVVYLVLW